MGTCLYPNLIISGFLLFGPRVDTFQRPIQSSGADALCVRMYVYVCLMSKQQHIPAPSLATLLLPCPLAFHPEGGDQPRGAQRHQFWVTFLGHSLVTCFFPMPLFHKCFPRTPNNLYNETLIASQRCPRLALNHSPAGRH